MTDCEVFGHPNLTGQACECGTIIYRDRHDPALRRIGLAIIHAATELDVRGGGRAIDTWSRRWPACRACGTTSRKHRARGLCTRCSPPAERAHKVLASVV